MSNELIAALLGALVGGLATSFGAILVDSFKDKRQLKLRKNLFALIIIDSVEKDLQIFNDLQSSWEKTETLWYEHTNEIKEFRLLYERNIENILIFERSLKNQVLDYYQKTKWLIMNLESSQNKRYELDNRLVEKTKELVLRTALSEEEAKIEAIKLMNKEKKEFDSLGITIKNDINKLRLFEQKGREIINSLKSTYK